MRLAIAFSGEGWGHTTRIAALTRELNAQIFLAPKRVHGFFKTNVPDATLYTVPFLKLAKQHNHVRILKTISSNMPAIINLHNTVTRIRDILRAHNIQGVISDYEPFTAIAAHQERIPLVYFNHQAIVDKYPTPRVDALLASLTNKLMMPTNNPVITSSFYGGTVGPLIRNELLNIKPTQGNHILIYLKQTLNNALLPILEKQHKHFEFYPQQNGNFAHSLATCNGIIAGAGHQIISEALYLEKPILAIPEKGQYEQILNATMLEKTGRGMQSSVQELKQKIPLFLRMLDQFPLQKDIHFVSKDSAANAARIISSALAQQHARAPSDQTTAPPQKTDKTSSHSP